MKKAIAGILIYIFIPATVVFGAPGLRGKDCLAPGLNLAQGTVRKAIGSSLAFISFLDELEADLVEESI